MTFPVIVHKSEYGYDVSCPSLPGCASQGDTYDEAIDNIRCAIKEYTEAVRSML
jgi:predicted RNase H-like HicB family nuclease